MVKKKKKQPKKVSKYRIEIAKQIAVVRNSGYVNNMFDRMSVVNALSTLDYEESALYIYNNPLDYIKLKKLSDKY